MTTINTDGRFETYVYSYSNCLMGQPEERLLRLEFRDGVLNGHDYKSSFKSDRTAYDFAAEGGIRAHSSTKADVEAAMGSPSGIFLCLSQMMEAADYEGVSEAWAWTSYSWQKGLKQIEQVIVSFDESGVVLKVTGVSGSAE